VAEIPGDRAVHPLKLASLLLQYPTAALRQELRDEPRPLGQRAGRDLEDFLGWYRAVPLAELEREYVRSFDFSKRASLHLTYHTDGDSRRRGVAMLRLKQAYAAAGLDVTDRELPDYLPLMCEFAALGGDAGLELLAEQAVSIELVRAALREERSRWRPVLDLVADELPGLTRRQLARVRRLAAEGPPTEQVGLEPFAPPEVMPPEGRPGSARPMVGWPE
jgi:nitrate reductase delta subunit